MVDVLIFLCFTCLVFWPFLLHKAYPPALKPRLFLLLVYLHIYIHTILEHNVVNLLVLLYMLVDCTNYHGTV